MLVPPGISGKKAKFDPTLVTPDMMACELALLQLGDVIPLDMYVDCGQFMSEIAHFRDDWVDYLPRTDRPNNRKGMTITNMPGKTHQSVPSIAQAMVEHGRRVSELEYNTPTDLFYRCPSIQPLMNEWSPVGRSFLVRSDTGGYFVPHRDHPSMPREVFRLAVFLNNCHPLQYDWLMDDNTKINIEHGRVYYINTRKTHRTISWVDNSIHLIMNVPFTAENVTKLIGSLQHTH